MASTTAPKITLYTNHTCLYSARVHYALAELNLPYTPEIIDLSIPRTPEFLKINPRGTLPAMIYNGTIINESAIVAQFLADAHPSHLTKESSAEGGALQRAKVGFFVDAFFSKVFPGFFPLLLAEGEKREELTDKLVDSVVKELEPLLQDAKPFFDGAVRLTMAEVMTASFVMTFLALPKYEDADLMPKSMLSALEAKAPAFWKWASAIAKEKSVTLHWREQEVAEGVAGVVAKMKGAQK